MRNYQLFTLFIFPFLQAFSPYLERVFSIDKQIMDVVIFLPIIIHALLFNLKQIPLIFSINKYYLFLIIYLLIALIWSGDINRGIYFLFYILMVPILTISLFKEKTGLAAWRSFSWGVLILSLLLYSGMLKNVFIYYDAQRFGLYSGDISLNPNSFGFWLNIAIGYFLYRIIIEFESNKKSLFKLCFQLINTFMLAYFIVLTGSRAAHLALLVSIIIIISIKRYRIFMISTPLIISFILVFILISQNLNSSNENNSYVMTRYESVLSEGLSERGDIWSLIFKISLGSPVTFLFGVGTGNAESAIGEIYQGDTYKVNSDNVARVNTHNLFLLFFLQSGVVGLILFVLMLYKIFNKIIHRFEDSNLNLFMLFLFTVFCIMSLTGSLIYNPAYPIIISIIFTIILFNSERHLA